MTSLDDLMGPPPDLPPGEGRPAADPESRLALVEAQIAAIVTANAADPIEPVPEEAP